MQPHWNSTELKTIETVTLGHYEDNAQAFWEGTKDHDVSQNYEALLSACGPEKPLDLLDFGCGPGRDVKHFKSLGYRPVGLDGSAEFCRVARDYTGCPVLHQHFLELDLPKAGFDGIFANASLFHVPSQELPRILKELHDALRPNGILFSSNPRGSAEGWQGQRYGHYMELPASQSYLEDAGFEILYHYYRPTGKPQHEQPWLAIVSRAISP
ncbi:MAG: class I SAM-dependent methyltransferase [SAR324 cluster bacterium]|nr:class I SAM-dependent methyltransferase [SAR324 cluster bacterium]